MASLHDRLRQAIPFVLVILLAISALHMVKYGRFDVSHGDPDTVLIQITLLTIAVIVFILARKFRNTLLDLGLALTIYAIVVQCLEEFTLEFTPGQLAVFSAILAAGFLLIVVAAFRSRDQIDRDIGRLRQQEARLIAGAEEQERLRAALEQSNRKLRLLTQITRHDISNRLLAVSGFISLARHGNRPEQNESLLEKADENLSAIGDIIALTKTYERIGMDTPAWQEVRPLIAETFRVHGRDGVKLENRVGQDLGIYADPMIGRVFYNLVGNALAYGGESLSRITFFGNTGNNDLVIVCEDDGCGIPAGEKELIFERGVGKNTGLGLFLSREILSLTGITIRECGEPGCGARFEIHVPEGRFRIGTGTDSPVPEDGDHAPAKG